MCEYVIRETLCSVKVHFKSPLLDHISLFSTDYFKAAWIQFWKSSSKTTI